MYSFTAEHTLAKTAQSLSSTAYPGPPSRFVLSSFLCLQCVAVEMAPQLAASSSQNAWPRSDTFHMSSLARIDVGPSNRLPANCVTTP